MLPYYKQCIIWNMVGPHSSPITLYMLWFWLSLIQSRWFLLFLSVCPLSPFSFYWNHNDWWSNNHLHCSPTVWPPWKNPFCCKTHTSKVFLLMHEWSPNWIIFGWRHITKEPGFSAFHFLIVSCSLSILIFCFEYILMIQTVHILDFIEEFNTIKNYPDRIQINNQLISK